MAQRHLAAIMFTDIVGYTSLMQVDEKNALSALDHHKKIVEQKVHQFNGNTIKFYGDGSLSIFDSVYKAVECALEIQKEIRGKPRVPLRIGIHTGEIINRDGDVYGDGINIASRLQSLGEKGSILFSSDVYDKIKNHPELKSVYLGKHRLKNVQSKVEVYALANPEVRIPRKLTVREKPDDEDDRPSKRLRNLKIRKSLTYSVIVLIFLILAAIIGLKIKQKREIQLALNNTLPALKIEFEQLINNPYGEKNWNIYKRAVDLKKILKDNPDLDKLWFDVTIPQTINTDPTGVNIYAKPYSRPDTTWCFLGKTPLRNFSFPRGLSRIKIEKADFNTQYDVILRHFGWRNEADTLNYQLFKEKDVPEEMVHVPGHKGDQFITPGLPDHYIGSFWIDRFEVTNKQYKSFLDSDGYTNSSYWEFPFIAGDDTLTFNDAKKRFIDKTGWIGPANWEMGDFPTGEGDLPVTGISWYEAAAYAKYIKKSLPTIYHWFYVSESLAAPEIVKFGNFNKKGPVEKGTYNSMTRFGTFDLPGNVSEWIFNANLKNRFIMGGNYKEPTYWYNATYGQISPWARGELVGFRCIRYIDDTLKQQLAQNFDQAIRDYGNLKPVSDDIFLAYKQLFNYESSELNETRISKSETDDWIQEIISINVPYEDAPMKILVLLPVNFKPPYQPIVYVPGLGAVYSNTMEDMNVDGNVDFFLKSGRAVIWPVYYSTFGRGEIRPINLYNWKQVHKFIMIDFQVVCDYLQTRNDLDSEKMAYYGYSWGGALATYILAIEKRIKLGILALFGISSIEKYRYKEFDQIDYVTQIKIPMLLLGGRYDFDYTLEQQQAFYDFLGTPKNNKKWIVYESTHWIPRKDLINESLSWLDNYLGPAEK